jgi:bacterioferritin-associated ferredoxin
MCLTHSTEVGDIQPRTFLGLASFPIGRHGVGMFVTRCICFRATFAALRKLVQSHGWTSVGQVVQHTRAGTGCGSCKPYIARMLETGATEFSVAEKGKPPQPAPGSGTQGIQEQGPGLEGVRPGSQIP